MAAAEQLHVIAPEDRARADLYGFLGLLLETPASAVLLDQIAGLRGDGSPIGEATHALSRLAGVTTPETAEREFNALFIGLGRGELLPYASYYLTGFLNEKPLAKLRADMAALGIARASGKHEPEDNIASLMEIMSGLISGRFGPPAGLADQRAFFEAHIGTWAIHFFTDLEGTNSSVFYAAAGALGRRFMEIEKDAFRMVRT
ncbi:MAG: molecular chaperone TorD family protein [Roseitalea sp.]|jgi:TorA maturation chaperone TorD|nr:molecular chaperone TorD family protein [Roseitalea sp.]MBO6722085.1 molecular chaperone TorD family protein [Roseitalea sp.]MBO6741705.1 molecular chaperone TorD family protein [Roseitalea sp.]